MRGVGLCGVERRTEYVPTVVILTSARNKAELG